MLALALIAALKVLIEREVHSALSETASRVIGAAIFFFSAHLLLDLMRLVVIRIYTRRRKILPDSTDNFTVGVNQITGVLSVSFFVLAFLFALNIAPREAFTSVSIVAAALAIITKDYISNMVNGMLIMFTDQLSLNDWVNIDGQEGKIVEINLLNVHLLNEDDDLVYIPNNTVLSTNVLNFTKGEIRRVSVRFEISNSYLASVPELEHSLTEALHSFAHEIETNSYTLKVVEVNKDATKFKFHFVLRKGANEETERQTRRRAVRKILEYIYERRLEPHR